MVDLSRVMGDRFAECTEVLGPESDRGAVVLGAAILDELLVELLMARMVPSLERDDEILEGYNAPCSSFGARIDLAYRLGTFGAQMRQSLHLIRKMRNDAAHTSRHRDLSSPELLGRLRALFKLNDGLLKYMWTIVQTAAAKSQGPTLPATPSADLVDLLGWRGAWDLFVSMIASGLASVPYTLPRLKSVDEARSTAKDGA